jgi:hypothetical protein
MNAIAQAVKTVLSLFIDDGSLALAIIALLAAVYMLAHVALLASPPVLMALLVGGTLLLLLENVFRAARRSRR